MDSEIIDLSTNIDSSDDDDDDDDDIYVNAAAKLESLRAQSFVIEDDEPSSIPSPKKSDIDVTDQPPLVIVNKLETAPKTKARKNRNINSHILNPIPSEVIALDDDDDDNNGGFNGPRTRSKTRGRVKKKTCEIIPVVKTPKSTLDLTLESVDTSTQSIELSDEEEPIDLTVDVKIRWISRDIKRFQLKKDENFTKIFKHFASLANVDENRIIITKNEIPISPLDTPSSLELSIIDILEGGFVNKCVQVEPVEDNTPKIKIKVQSSLKKFWNFDFNKDEKFQKIFDLCAKENNVPVTKLKCFFDGELIMPTGTPDDLDIEDEACFDLKIIS
ncbi:uncharacterized protein CG4449 [Chelonus insularis]|uniref:uncharacterized protein CG4449 n=1 Tax=Chelonus insularis TaxID=460826 RepID=UPI00158DC40F|nr:uncharacterized protein CG4449 [Chelonus insularis]